MIQLNQAHKTVTHNEDSIQELLWEIAASKSQFSLVLARCDYASLRQQIIQQISERSPGEIAQFSIPESAKRLYSSIRDHIADQQPDALMLIGLESVQDLEQMLVAVNQVREEFRKNFQFSLVMWVTDEVLKKLIRYAPDFESWSTTTAFTLPTVTLVEELQNLTDRLFTQITDLGDAPTLSNGTVWDAQYRHELAAALRDLQTRHQQLELGLTAGLEFAFGLSDYSKDAIDSAVSHYRTSLKFWQSTRQLDRQGILLFYLGLCYARRAEQYGSDQCFCWEEARHYFQACIDSFEQDQRLDLVARFINRLGKVLQCQEKWGELLALAEKSLQLQKNYDDSYRLAQVHGLLARVALQQSRWRDAKEHAEHAIDLDSLISSQLTSQQSLYLLLLAKALQGLGDSLGAVENLEKAKALGPQDAPKLYVQILEALRELYFKQKRYLDAFCLKQERLSTEQQYGLRAFIGAGRLKSQRQVRTILGLAEQRAMAAQEIAASGRQADIQQLLERIGSTQHRLTVLYGQSGVGKSSLVEAGLIPTLKQTSVGTYDVLPILLRVYTHWVGELGQTLTTALETLPAGPTAKTSCQSLPEILDQLKRHERYNLLTVLIFDQFEEFFFIYKKAEERKHFFEFLQDCLNLPSIKVILSLREDYLHYLLAGSRRVKLDVINNNILDKGILYHIGNFSLEEAKAVVLSLIHRSQLVLEPALVDAFVSDLTNDGEEIRPIELQVVGAQLQTEEIKTLEEYLAKGPKELLVQRYLAEVVADCGPENQQLAELVLYFLTDENNTRPLKTRADLEESLGTILNELSLQKIGLELVLKIFVSSGLVFLLPEIPANRYQLVHDYLVTFIRHQRGGELVAELEKEREKRKKSEQQLNRALKQKLRVSILASTGLIILTGLSIFFGMRAEIDRQHSKVSEAKATASYAESQLASGRNFDGLINSLKAFSIIKQPQQRLFISRLLTRPEFRDPEVNSQVEQTLQKAVFKVRERNRLEGHTDTVFSTSFSPDGQMIATASRDGEVKLWSLDGEELITLKGHDEGVSYVAFSPNGRMIATASYDNTVKLWNIDGTEIRTIFAHDDIVWSVRFSPDGQKLVTASEDKTAKLWSLEGQLLQTLAGHEQAVLDVDFSPDGQEIATASFDNTARLWNLDGQNTLTFTEHIGPVFSIAFSPDGQKVVTGSGGFDKSAIIWALDGTVLHSLIGHEHTISSVHFSPDGQVIVTASADDTIRLWGHDGQPLRTIDTGHERWVWEASISPDGRMIASGGGDSSARLWQLNPYSLLGHKGTVYDVTISPNTQMIATAGADKTVKLWQLNGSYLGSLLGHNDEVRAVTFSPNSQLIATAGIDGTARLWDLDGKELQAFSGHQDAVLDVSLSPDGERLATASQDNTVKVWNLMNLEDTEPQELSGHSELVRRVQFSPDGQMIATASWDGTAKLWELQGEEIVTFKGHDTWLMDVAFSPDGQMIATASVDDTAKLWNLQGEELVTLKGHSRTVNQVEFSPDGQTVATASKDGTVKLWNLAGENFYTFYGHAADVTGVSFSPDGSFIVSSDVSGQALRWYLDWTLDDYWIKGCNWVVDYLENNPNVEERDRHLCDGLSD